MGSGASFSTEISEDECKKPLDGCDINDFDAAKAEVIRLRGILAEKIKKNPADESKVTGQLLHDSEYYKKQADLYFDTLQSEPIILPERPNYSAHVVRWEWKPWLLLTGYGAAGIRASDGITREACARVCVDRTHKYFDTHPYARSTVTFY